MINFEDLVVGFKELGISKGDILMVHSSFKSFGGVNGGASTVVDALLDVIGKDGTLVMPTFTFGFCEQFNKTGKGFFFVEHTPSEMGILTEIVRWFPSSKRSVNPIYSVAVCGKLQDELSSVCDKNVFGRDSIFGRLHDLDAKVLTIGLGFNKSWTFIHYIEEMENVDYRHHKKFSGLVIDDKGLSYTDTFVMRVRNKNVATSIEDWGAILEKKGVIKAVRIGNSIVQIMSCKTAFDVTVNEMRKNPNILYKRNIR